MKKEIKERIEMINSGEVPEGYKKTKLGIIPEDWNVKTLDRLGTFSKGKGIKRSEVTENGFKCIRYGEIYTDYDYSFTETKSFINKKTIKKTKAINYGDILFAGSGETLEDIGKCVSYLSHQDCYAGGDIVIFTPKKEINSNLFSFILNSNYVNEQKYKYGQGQSIIHIYSSSLKKIKVPSIKINEQKQIANILQTWDKSIELKEKLLKKKKGIKKGLMQRLLTGEVRLKGFDDEWREVNLNKLINVINGYAFKSNKYVDKGIPVIRISNIDKKIDQFDNKIKYYDKFRIDNKYVLEKGDIVIAMSGATTGKLGRYWLNIPSYLNQRVGKFVTKNNSKFNYEFLYYWLVSANFDKELYKILDAGSQPNISGSQIKKMIINYPIDIEEQKSIAEILSKSDQSIELLEKEIELLREQKKGLMQLLLTGKVRVDEIN